MSQNIMTRIADIEVILTFNFFIPSYNDSFVVPFNVTKQELATPILGFNIIEHLVKEYPNLKLLEYMLNSVFPTCQFNSRFSGIW